MSDIQIDIEILPSIDNIVNDLNKSLEVMAVNAQLDTLDWIQGKFEYTRTGNPRLPSGSQYRRTFNLLRSYKRGILRNKFPVITSRWEAKRNYATYVIGSKQAAIHRSRWDTIANIRGKAEVTHREFISQRLDNNEVSFRSV